MVDKAVGAVEIAFPGHVDPKFPFFGGGNLDLGGTTRDIKAVFGEQGFE